MASSTDNVFLGRGFETPHPLNVIFYDFPHVKLEKNSPRYPQEIEQRGC